MQAAYEEFGCNEGNVFFLGIDKGNTNEDVIYFDSIYGIQYPGISGNDGGGNEIHLAYDIQGSPSLVVIAPDREILVHQVFPPSFESVVDSILNAGGIPQACLTSLVEYKTEEVLTIKPNPATDYVYLNFSLEKGGMIMYKIYNITGQVVAEIEPSFYMHGKYILKADLSFEPKGFYFVQIYENNKVLASKKLILQ
ncbi:MAG: T9SS type A sorting domain-containing protein [Bacteroidales bacterium]|nr:T9SS type A sorting domain-containing protein [Bacteroidales bacterium]